MAFLGKGVPIGGFISAQAAELWAIWKEHRVFANEHRLRPMFVGKQ